MVQEAPTRSPSRTSSETSVRATWGREALQGRAKVIHSQSLFTYSYPPLHTPRFHFLHTHFWIHRLCPHSPFVHFSSKCPNHLNTRVSTQANKLPHRFRSDRSSSFLLFPSTSLLYYMVSVKEC